MTGRYGMLYFKPTSGTGGQGISKITRAGEQTFQIQNNSGTSRVKTVQSLQRRLARLTGGRSYLLQRGIHLKRTRGRPFDLRVMLQKENSGSWTHSAIFSKIGKPGKVATNYHQGGSIGTLDGTLRGAGYSGPRIRQLRGELRTIGSNTARCFDRHLKGFRELGLDVAVDKDGRCWILEVNTRPQFRALLKTHRAMYDRIYRIGRQYGRRG